MAARMAAVDAVVAGGAQVGIVETGQPMRRWRRSILVCFLTGAVLLSSAGTTLVALPVGRGPVVAADEWFPCRGHRCGCVSDHMCRTRCCCRRPASTRPAAGRSCPDHAPAAHHDEVAGRRSVSMHLVIQAPSCRGQDPSGVLGSVTWLIRMCRCDVTPAISPERVEPAVPARPDGDDPAPEPPPPRVCLEAVRRWGRASPGAAPGHRAGRCRGIRARCSRLHDM